MFTTSKNSNPNYLCKLVQVTNLEKHPNADRLQITNIDFNTIITGTTIKLNDWVVYFPLECTINKDFLSVTNSFRKSELNVDKEAKGFFEEDGRVKATKLRGQRSMGYIVPVEEVLKFANLPLNTKLTTCYFDTVNEILLAKKYKIKHNKSETSNKKELTKSDKKAVVHNILEGQFKFHIDTPNLRKEIYNIRRNDLVSITYKLHGSSVIVSNLLHTRPLKWYEKFVNKYITPVKDTYYDLVISSRKVIKTVDNQQHYYKEDIWRDTGLAIKDRIPPGYSLYGEIVGYLTNGSYIQKDYDYGLEKGKKQLYIYRITYTSPENNVIELSTTQCEQFCKHFGLEFVPIFENTVPFEQVIQKYCKSSICVSDLSDDDFYQLAIQTLEAKFTENNCYMCNNKVPEEGIIIRVENSFKFDVKKLKGFRFLEKESKQLDTQEVDLEEEQKQEDTE